ncbi:MAG: heparinase II/III family protein [Tepidisphaeraceae bacterium]
MLSQQWFWYTATNNWNSVCHAGCAVAALAVKEREPALSAAVIELVHENLGRVAESYGPDGAYDEGPMYWDYGTTFLALLCSAMETAGGTPFDPKVPGLMASADYMAHIVAPSGRFYNYSDCRLERSPTPTLFWFARKLGRPSVAGIERARYGNRESIHQAVDKPAHEGERLLALGLIWQQPAGDSLESCPTLWVGGGRTPVALMRTAWTPEAAFLGIKGGSPSASHGHMDVGSFVYENAGVRWAIDLPLQEYHGLEAAGLNLWSNEQASDRWRVFRLGPEGHGILRIDDKPQAVSGAAPLTLLDHAHAIGSVAIDLTSIYPELQRVERIATLNHDGSLEIIDRWQGNESPHELTWQMLTTAAVELHNGGFDLAQSGKRLRIEFRQPGDQLALRVDAADSLTSAFDAANPGVSRLSVRLKIPTNHAGELRTRLFLA